ncbi:hypothetical protein A3Q56_04748 [Intoshia linei]|uniref:Dynein heavy chain tail domain-containing protein n=1 Tax=Intoshia linei TaxID=1819745 RepID=A0A177AZR9_9BILA|nr:hypothetical protein A3Q56_04748 [Intoshia linei]
MSAKNKKRNSEVSIPLVNLPTGDLEDSKNKSMRSTKKGGMVSSETLREKQKYNKAIREDRRNTIDNRHQFIFSKLADALQVEINVVQDMVLIDENFDKIDNFFAVSGPNTISFIVQNVTFDYGKCYYFLKIVPEKPITHKNIVSDTIWGEKLNSEDLKVREFMDKLQNFVSNLSGANKNMTGHIELSSDSVNNYISNLESASEYQQSLTNSDNVEKIDKVLQQWNIQIEQVLAQSEQIRREADDVGPSAELQYWKNRMVQFNTLLQKMKNKNVKMVIILAHIAKLKSFNAWKIMDAKITDLANEANDNVKYLYTLEKYLIPLSKYDPTNMIIFLPNLIKVIRMIYTVSSYYNTSERMTSLFVKVTNQMIKTSKRYINFGVSRIWELSSDEMKKRMNDCIKLNEAYQEEFHKVKENLSELPNEKQFEFSENYIFGKIDTFCKRINLVLSLLDYIDSFSEIQNISIEGIDTIYLKYKSIVDMIKKKSYDFLDHRRPEFENDYGDMKNQFLNLKTLIHKFIDGWLQKSLSTEKSLILLKKFYIIRKDHLNLEDKYVKVFLSYGKDLELIKKIYMKLKNEPIVSHYLPPICGKITWSRLLYRRIEEPMLVFNKMPHILKISEANKVIKNYNKLAKILTEFELLYYRGWCRAIEISKKSLNSPILIKISENTFKVNFDIQIIELIKEARYLKEMKFKLSDTANLFISLESGIIKNYNNLNDLIIEHRTVVDSIPSTILILLKPYIHRIEEILLQGCDRLSWSSLNISNFLLNSRKSLSNLKKIVKNARDILECRIMEIFDQVSETELFSIQNEESMDTEEFAKIIMKSCHDIFDTICKKSQLAELAVFDLIDLLNSGLTESESKKMFQDNGQGVVFTSIIPKKIFTYAIDTQS